ncbi:MAG: hypothetical protein RLZZ195_4 [Pseudomonadota bacterium]|jgi:hypothetical protein
MEKKGELLNQLALISDLIEKTNLESKSSTIIFEVSKVEFEKIFDSIQKKYGKKINNISNSFTINMGVVDIIFNTSNV